jgi:shikimate dehydrogenase
MVSRRRRASGITYDELTDKIIERSHLIVNTTSLGMWPHTEEAPSLDYRAISPRHLLFDLIYHPPLSLFLRKGKEQGAQVVNGLRMLQIQADASFTLWERNPDGFSF